MATITKQTIRVDLTPGRVYPVLHVSQGDVGLEALEFYVYQNGQPFTIPSEVTAINIDGMTPVGVFSYPCTWTGNVVTAGLTATMTAERGIDICELALYDATNNKIGTCNFVIAVEESPFTNAHVSTSDMATIMAAASSAQQYELLAKSWAVGDTGIRTGEDTDNSKYWSEQSEAWVDMAESWAVGGTGKRAGEDTNNSEYWSGVAHQYANTVSFKTYDTVAQMKADTGLLDGGVCRTLGKDAINDGYGALYYITDVAPSNNYYVALSNGLYAVTGVRNDAYKYIENGDYAVSVMGDAALSYIKYTDEGNDTSSMFFYDRSGEYNNWGTKPTELVDGKHGITCSPFVMSLLYGVPFEHSAYIDGSNQLEPNMFKNKDLVDWFYPPRIDSTYLAQYAIENGYAFFPEPDLSNLRPGDVIFMPIEGSEDNIYSIGHCEIFGYWINNNHYLVWHAGSVPRTNIRTAADVAENITLCARFPFAINQMAMRNIVAHGEADVEHTTSTSPTVANYNLSETIPSNQYYTAIFKMTSANDIADQYPSIRTNNPEATILSKTYANATEKPLNNVYCIPFYSQTPLDSIRLAMARKDDTVSYDTVTVEWMIVTKGIVTSPVDYIAPPFELYINKSELVLPASAVKTYTPTNGTAFANWGGCYYYKVGTRVHIHMGISGLTSGSATQIGSIPAGYRPYTQCVFVGRSDQIANVCKFTINPSGTMSIRSEDDYANVDAEYDAYQ